MDCRRTRTLADLFVILCILDLVLAAAGGVHLPIRRARVRERGKRAGESAAVVGLGDNMDVTYNVLVQVGGTLTPLIIDTGSSDLWLVTDACGERCSNTHVPLYSRASLKSTGEDVQLLYGDSRTGTHASGPIGMDTVSIAGLTVSDQYFAAIVDTNTTVLETGSAGILGLGFPPISLIWRQLLSSKYDQPMPSSLDLPPSMDLAEATSPRSLQLGESQTKRQNTRATLDAITDTFSTLGPLLARLVTLRILERPLVVTTFQRDTISLSRNDGTLSMGALPFGISDDQLSWVPVRSYSVAEGGLPPPPGAPNEVYPLLWEIPIDAVYFDNAQLPRSGLSLPSISLSALVDTGNSLIRGPQDVLAHIYAALGLDAQGTFDCSNPHNLTFVIGGKPFPIDPRDFAHPAAVTPGTVYPDEAARCTPALAATDPPGQGGFLYSWSLGDPFLKSTMVAFYYGNMTHPSQDPARVGFMSMVPSDAGHALEQAVDSAIANGGVFLSTSEPAPYATAARLVSPMTAPAGAVMPQVTQGSTRALSGAASTVVARRALDVWMASLIAAFLSGLVLDFVS
ncbi:acid protease [Trametes polyzona]|nr:acid protease [Trametes polyzona]